VLYACSRSCSEDADYIETQGFVVWPVFDEVLLGEGADGGLLAGRYGLERAAEARGAAELHLYEDEGIIVSDYEVYLAAPLPVIARDESVAAPDEVAQREVLSPGPGGSVRQSPTPA
jgi:hypothetical protein